MTDMAAAGRTARRLIQLGEARRGTKIDALVGDTKERMGKCGCG